MAAAQKVPVIPIRNRVLFPFSRLRLTLGRPSSLSLVKHTFRDRKLRGDRFVGIVAVGGAGRTSAGRTPDDHADPSAGGGSDNPSTRPPVPTNAEPAAEDLFSSGCLARVLKLTAVKQGDNQQYHMWVEGVARMTVVRYTQTSPFRIAVVARLPSPRSMSPEVEALSLNIRAAGEDLLEALKQVPGAPSMKNINLQAMASRNPEELAYALVSATTAPVENKMAVLEAHTLEARLKTALELIVKQTEVVKMFTKIRSHVTDDLKKGQRKFYLRQQLRAIKKELGEDDASGGEDAANELQARIDAANLPSEAAEVAAKELKRLARINPASPEHAMVVTYLEWLADLPWGTTTGIAVTPSAAQAQLDADHAGLDKVKRRIVEYMAVRQLNPSTTSPILLLVGPPGVGKTSLGRSVAAALARKFHRMSLGGLRDVAEIRGHRRTYIGSMPGIVVQTLKRAGAADPVILLDEIDKLGHDFRGDPASALLEVLDPEQNVAFMDHYLGVAVDLSKVLFLATANTTETIPPALLDRMEVIRLPGYTVREKVDIARRYLWSKQLKEHGLTHDDVSINDDVFRAMVERYTREAGVRTLERCLASLCRRAAVQVASHRMQSVARAKEAASGLNDDTANDVHDAVAVSGDGDPACAGAEAATAAPSDGGSVADHPLDTIVVSDAFVTAALGQPLHELELAMADHVPGVVAGLAWTPAGGRLLFVEATHMPGSGKLRLTGQLGSVMKESAHAALSWIRSHASQLGLASRPLADKDIHIHFPAGAIPKDGPSAGIAITTALVSSLTHRCARCDTAMTGEVTLRGSVLPVGGIKEKLLGAHRGGIRRVILSSRNERDVEDVPKEVRDDLTIFYVSKVDDVFDLVLEEAPTELRPLSAHHEAATKADNEAFARVAGGSAARGSGAGAGAGAGACAGSGGHVCRGDSDQRVAVTAACMDDAATNPLLSFL